MMKRRLSCLCESITIELTGAPVARANCHCSSCRDFYGVSMLSATAWKMESVRIVEGRCSTFQHPRKQLSKTFCAACGDVLFGTARIGLHIVPNAIAARASNGTLDADLSPTMHLFYEQREIEVADALVKYREGWDGPVFDASAR